MPLLLLYIGVGATAPWWPGREARARRIETGVAVAALVLLVLSIALRRLELPGGEGLEAKDTSREQAVEALEGLNDREADE